MPLAFSPGSPSSTLLSSSLLSSEAFTGSFLSKLWPRAQDRTAKTRTAIARQRPLVSMVLFQFHSARPKKHCLLKYTYRANSRGHERLSPEHVHRQQEGQIALSNQEL